MTKSKPTRSAAIRRLYPVAASTFALVIALTGAGAMASGVLVTSKQIKNGTITSQDLKNNGIRGADIKSDAIGSSDIASGAVGAGEIAGSSVGSADLADDAVRTSDIAPSAVTSSDIGDGQVTASDVTMPEPLQIISGATITKNVGHDFDLIDEVVTYDKQDANSILQVDWSGSAAAGFLTCVFQLRVDGFIGAPGAGETFMGNGQVSSINTSGLFESLGTGPHRIEVWARTNSPADSAVYPCTIGPESAGISQTFIVSEQVI